MKPLITSRTDWTDQVITDIYKHIEEVALEDLELDVYPNQIEVISSESMIDAYASIGMPINYNHWSFGKEFLKNWSKYNKGKMGLAYEIVINSNPCISYLMEENNAITQALVIAHAAFGHNFVFKNNYMFKEWTTAGSIIDYMVFAKNYIIECEAKYGESEVEAILDAAHALALHGIDKRKRKYKKKKTEEDVAREDASKEDEKHKDLDIIIQTTSIVKPEIEKSEEDLDDVGDEENLLYFIYKNAPNMPQWKREILRIVYKIRQYFYPQAQEKCVTGDNLISTDVGLLRLDELINEVGHIPVNGINLLTQGDKFTPISHTYLNRSAHVVKVTTRTGREFIGTPEHPLMALSGTEHSLKKLGKLSSGDHLVINTNYKNIFSKNDVILKPVTLNETVECEICGLKSSYIPTHIKDTHGISPDTYTGSLSSELHRANKSVNYPTRFPTTLNIELAELLGYWNRITYPSGVASIFSLSCDENVANRVIELLDTLFDINVEATTDEYTTIKHISFSSWGLRKFLELNFNLTSSTGILKEIRCSTSTSIVTYIRALFTQWGYSGYFTHPDNDTISQVQTILLSLGIVSVVKSNQRVSCEGQLAAMFNMTDDYNTETYTVKHLFIPKDYQSQFISVFGDCLDIEPSEGNINSVYSSYVPGAKKLLDEIILFIKNKKKEHFQSIPEGLSYAKKIQQNLLWKQQSLPAILELPEIRSSEISMNDVMQDVLRFEKALNVPCEAAAKLGKLLANSVGCFYDTIVSVEELDECRAVYDVTVPENHLFWMSGIISHNTLNEGMATFTHFYIMDELEKKGLISPDAQLAWLHLHSNVIYQPDMHSRHYDGQFNPYALGFDILKEVRRVCEYPTKEDVEWFPKLAGSDWRTEIKRAVTDYRDESFIEQFMTPNLMRKYKMMTVESSTKIVSDISDDLGYRNMRHSLALQYNQINYIPDITVKSARMRGDRMLTLEYKPYRGRSLHRPNAEKTLRYVKQLWEYDVEIVECTDPSHNRVLFRT